MSLAPGNSSLANERAREENPRKQAETIRCGDGKEKYKRPALTTRGLWRLRSSHKIKFSSKVIHQCWASRFSTGNGIKRLRALLWFGFLLLFSTELCVSCRGGNYLSSTLMNALPKKILGTKLRLKEKNKHKWINVYISHSCRRS